MKFGVGHRKKLSGAELAVRILQGAALPPALFILTASAHPPAMLRRSVLSVLCELGFSALPRWELLALSWLYRLSASEIAVTFALLVFALAFGLAAGPLLRGERKRAVLSRRVFALLMGLELLLRLIPLSFSLAFGLVPAILGFLVRLGCLILTLLDLRAERKREKEEE